MPVVRHDTIAKNGHRLHDLGFGDRLKGIVIFGSGEQGGGGIGSVVDVIHQAADGSTRRSCHELATRQRIQKFSALGSNRLLASE